VHKYEYDLGLMILKLFFLLIYIYIYIVQTICKLEMIFSLLVFDSMEYLPIYVPYEAKVEGSVQYRWMYPFERLDITHVV